MLPLKKILAPTDFSEPSYAALDNAIELAAHFEAELCLLHIVPFLPPSPPDLVFGFVAVTDVAPDAERLDNALKLLHQVEKKRVPPGIKASCEVKMGHADKEITCAAADGNFDLLVIATHGLSGWRHLVFGSVAEAIMRKSLCPVLTIHAASAEDNAVAEQDEKINGMTPVRQEVGLAAENVENAQGSLAPC